MNVKEVTDCVRATFEIGMASGKMQGDISLLKAFELLKWAAKVIKLRDLKSPRTTGNKVRAFSVGASRHAGRPDLSRHWSKNYNDVVKENNRPEPATVVKLNSIRTEISCNIFKQHRG
ncbi:hypothetical protein AAG906_016416 [Vitis piasezkii]